VDWKAAAVSFAIIFLAELGDKTQLMVMTMSARAKSPAMVFFGAAAALVMSALVASLAGDALLRHVPLRMLRLGTGMAFMGIGSLLLYKASR
jgi:Ca2+/H+ antiporter, TMEM165/GDT1 family